MASIWGDVFKEVKPTADLGYKAYVKLNDFTNQDELAHVIRKQNVVVNCIGSRIHCQRESEFEESNIRVPMAIAKACAANPNVKRLIHVSAAGADPNSQSMRLRTKWIGEQEVKEAFPDVTIIRPTYMMSTVDPNPTIAHSYSARWLDLWSTPTSAPYSPLTTVAKQSTTNLCAPIWKRTTMRYTPFRTALCA